MKYEKPFASVLINCKLGKESQVTDDLKLYASQMDGIKNVDVEEYFGIYDMIARIYADGKDSVNEYTSRIRKIPDVNNTMTLISIRKDL